MQEDLFVVTHGNHIEELVRPLMVLHGANDRNVAFRRCLQLIDVLVKLDKDFEMSVYSGG